MSLARTLRALTKNKQRSVDSAVCLRTMSVIHFRNARCGPMKGDAAFKLLGGSHHQETGGVSFAVPGSGPGFCACGNGYRRKENREREREILVIRRLQSGKRRQMKCE